MNHVLNKENHIKGFQKFKTTTFVSNFLIQKKILIVLFVYLKEKKIYKLSIFIFGDDDNRLLQSHAFCGESKFTKEI